MVNDAVIIADLERALWQDRIVPYAARDAKLGNARYQLREEGEIIWRELSKDLSLARLCVEAVVKHENQYAAFAIERDLIVRAFGQVCVRGLEQTFIRPLLRSVGLLEEYDETTLPLPDMCSVRSKLDAIFEEHPRTSFYRQSIVEHYGVNNFNVLYDKVTEIVEGLVEESS